MSDLHRFNAPLTTAKYLL